MRKLAIVIIFALLLCSVGCDGPNDSNEIDLTIDNFEYYVNLSCQASADSKNYSNGKYCSMIGYASCTGISGYYYDNVSVTIKIIFDDGTNDATPSIGLKLNVGGNASGSNDYLICNKKTGYLSYVSASTITAYSKYQIVYVHGKVRRL
ncbi:MAG: hypothetical protein J5762_06290 [Clostridia bacterium]|nr:hypothetical protein [Clostridia bacterium]